MIIFKCFVCGYESNFKKEIKSKEIGKTYLCPKCKKFHGCLVETETQKEFPKDYILKVKSSKTIPRYYAKKEPIAGDSKNVNVYIQVFEAINIKKGTFEYVFTDVPGSYKRLDKFWSRVYEQDIELIKPVGKFVLDTMESRKLPFQRISRNKKNIEDFLDTKPIDTIELLVKKKDISEKDKNKIIKLENKVSKLYESLNKLDIYKISTLDLNYLLNNNLNFKRIYIISKQQQSRMKKKYNVTKQITYNNNTQLNSTWKKDEVYYLGIPDLENIQLWLRKAYTSNAVCCGFVPFAPFSEWFKYYITDRANYTILKQQDKIPFPLVEFSFRYTKKPRLKKVSKFSLLNKEDIALNQIEINFSKLKKGR